MSELKNTVYRKLVRPGENRTNDIIKQIIKIQKFYMHKKPEYPYEAYRIVYITTENTMFEVINRIKTVLDSDEELKQEMSEVTLNSSSNIIYTCDIIILPIYFNEIDIDSIMEAVHKTKPNIKVVAIIIDKLKRLKGVPSTDIMFSASIQLIDAKLKKIAIDNDVTIIYNKQIPKESIMFV